VLSDCSNLVSVLTLDPIAKEGAKLEISMPEAKARAKIFLENCKINFWLFLIHNVVSWEKFLKRHIK
jgi:hypothetical protein